MSYDLTIPGGEAASIASLPRAQEAAEIHGRGGGTLVCLGGDDEAMYVFVSALLAWATVEGLQIEDPQQGRVVRVLGDLRWLTPPAVRGKTLKTLIKNWTQAVLAPHGFVVSRGQSVQRMVDGLAQGFEFLPPRRGSFDINVFWTIRVDGDDSPADSYAGARRLGELMGAPGTTFPANPLTKGFAQATTALLEVGLPYLERYAGIDRLVTGVESGALEPHQAFGPDVGWQAFHRGECLAYVGRAEDAVAAYREVVEQHSGWEYAWVQERKSRAEAAMAELTA